VISDPCIYSNDVENFINFIIPFKSAKCQNDCGLQVSSSVFENGPFVSFRKRNCFSSLSYFPRKKVLKMIKCYFLLLFFCFDLLNMEHKRNMGGKSWQWFKSFLTQQNRKSAFSETWVYRPCIFFCSCAEHHSFSILKCLLLRIRLLKNAKNTSLISGDHLNILHENAWFCMTVDPNFF
jgi:hypothetical protein